VGGIPIKMQLVSTLHRIYNEVLRASYYITFLCVIMYFVVKKEDMHESMKKVRMIFSMAFTGWLHLYLR
jgi:hypothetical protein